GHAGLMAHPGLVAVERHRHGEDRLPVLDRDHAPGGEALAVADAVDLVDDRHLGIAGEQEIGVQRVWRPPRALPRPAVPPRPATSPVGQAAAGAGPIAWPPNTRCHPTCGERPRNRFTSSCSRSRMARRSWTADDIADLFDSTSIIIRRRGI